MSFELRIRILALTYLILFLSNNVKAQELKTENDSVTIHLLQSDSIVLNNDSIVAFSEINDSVHPKNKIWKNFKSDAHLIGGSFINGFTQPIRWKKDDYIKAGITIAGVSMLYLVDEDTSEFFRKQRNHVPHGIRKAGWVFGRPEASYGLTSGIYLYGLFTNNEQVRETGVLLISSAAISGVFQQTTKTIVGRGRPNIEKGKNQFRMLRGGQDYGSFPSGHSILSTTILYGLSKQFSNPWVKAGFYTAGVLTPVSRLWEGAHWLTDVTLSIVTSVAIVEGVDHYIKKKKQQQIVYENVPNELLPKKKIKWNLVAGGNSVGLVGIF